MKVPVSKAKQLAGELRADAVIIIAFKGDRFGTTSYGKDRATCQAFAKVCEQIAEDIEEGIIPVPLPPPCLGSL